MAKKRKLRPSDPEPTKALEAEPQEEQSQEATVPVEDEQLPLEPEQIQGGDSPQEQQEDMAVDDSKEEEHEEPREEEQQEVGGKELGEQEEHENLDASKEAQPVTANGAEVKDEEEEEDEDDDEEPVENFLETFSKDQLLTVIKKAVDKHPDLIEGVRELADADPAHRKIFVHGLGWDTTAENLISVFGSYGEIEDCKAVTDRVSGKSKGYAFILFKHRSGARKALRQPQKQIGNRTTSCQLASSGPVPTPPPVTPPVSEYTQRKIFVSNVSAEVDTNKLLDFFKQYGEIEDGPLGLDKQTGKPKGFALFVYKTVDSAKKALEEPHKNFEGLTLHCQKAIDGPKQKHYQQQPPFPHHQHSHYHSRKEKNKYPSAGAIAPGHGHLMAPSGPAVGYNPTQGLNPVLGQALSTLLATQGAGLGLGNLLGGLGGAPVNQAGPPAGYGNQAGGSYGNQPLMQGGYQNPQMGQSSAVRPHPGSGPPYMGH